MAYLNSKGSDQPGNRCGQILLFYVHYSIPRNKILATYTMYPGFFLRPSIYYRTSVARTPKEPRKHVRDRGSSS